MRVRTHLETPMKLSELTAGLTVWGGDTDEWGPEPLTVVCVIDHQRVAVRRASGEVCPVYEFECYPTRDAAFAGTARQARMMVEMYEGYADGYRRALARIQAAEPIDPDEPIPFTVAPLVARIAGPGIEDLADLHVPPLSEVDPEAMDIGHTPNVGADVTRHDLRGVGR